MADQKASGENGNRTEVANYVATLSADLATMARRSGLDTLGFLLEVVRLEADSKTRHGQYGGRRLGQLDAEPFEKRRGRIAVRHHPQLGLLGADIVAQVKVNMSFEVEHLVAER